MSKRSVRVGVLFGLTVCAVLLALAVRYYRMEASSFYDQRRPVHAPAGAPQLEPVHLRTHAGDRLEGWYVPSKNRAAVVLCHGSGGDRSALLDEARLLSEAGFGALLFDWPGHGESEGAIHWSSGERDALRAALDWLSARADVDPDRLGAYGFSIGGFMVATYAPSDLRLRAVAIAGTPSDARQHLRWEYRRLGWLSLAPATLAAWRAGFPLDGPMPREQVTQIAPRPLLIITGSDDMLVPPWMAEQLYAAAREPKQLLVLAGAQHGGYTAQPRFGKELAEFFTRGLL